ESTGCPLSQGATPWTYRATPSPLARTAWRTRTAGHLRKGRMIALFDYATPSVFESNRDRALLGVSANARRPVRFHGRVARNIPLFRFALRALGEAIWSNDTWLSQGAFGSWLLDPVITVHPDRVFFEAFSQDQSVYAMLV